MRWHPLLVPACQSTRMGIALPIASSTDVVTPFNFVQAAIALCNITILITIKIIPWFLWNKGSQPELGSTIQRSEFYHIAHFLSSITDFLQPHHRKLPGFRAQVYPPSCSRINTQAILCRCFCNPFPKSLLTAIPQSP